MKVQTNGQVLEIAHLIINNTQKDADIQKRMTSYGFSPKRMQDGKGLLEKAEMLQDTKTIHYDERWAISHQIDAELETMRTIFKDHVQVARTAFRHEPALLRSLHIGRIAIKKWECIRQAVYFYGKLEEHALAMEPYGISGEVLQQTKTSMEALLDMKEDRLRMKGVSEDSTQEKKKAFRELKTWVVEFRGIARFAFKDNPQMLEAFGIRVPSLR